MGKKKKKRDKKRVQKGWECPKCGRVLAPWKSMCPCSTPKTEDSPWRTPYENPESWPKPGDPKPWIYPIVRWQVPLPVDQYTRCTEPICLL